MRQVLHGSATTTMAIRRAIRNSQANLKEFARRYGVNPKTVAKWRACDETADLRTGPKVPRSIVLTLEEEAIRRIAAEFLRALGAAIPYRIHTMLTDKGRILFRPARSPRRRRISNRRCGTASGSLRTRSSTPARRTTSTIA